MESIRPATRLLPASVAVLEESSLPLACVLTPLGDDCDESAAIPRLTHVLKCSSCGAPHPDTISHHRPPGSTAFVCYLCGKESFDVSATPTQEKAQKLPNGSGRNVPLDSIHCYSLPLRIPCASGPGPLYSLPASACPPLWFIVLDGSFLSTAYWKKVCHVLTDCLPKLPPHVHVSILIAFTDASDQSMPMPSLGVVQLDSPFPHLRYLTSNISEPLLLQSVMNSLVPADASHIPHIRTALRSLVDYSPPVQLSKGLPLHWSCSVIAAALEELGQAAGRKEPESPSRPYAGAKITVIAGQRVSGLSNRVRRSAAVGSALRGRIAVSPGKRFDAEPVQENEASDMTQPALSEHYAPPVEYRTKEYAMLGENCAAVAASVDLLFVMQRESLDDTVPDFGISLVGAISDYSGAPAPALIDSIDQLLKEVTSRAPTDIVFGADLRLRVSPGFSVLDEGAAEDSDQTAICLFQLLTKNGLNGPGYSVGDRLWRLGTCQSLTTLTVDLEVTGEVPDKMVSRDTGETWLMPCIQTCLAYTTIIEEEGSFRVVRHMRIATLQASLAPTVESLYGSLDPEAMAAVLFHRLSTTVFEEGIFRVSSIAHAWLASLMVCAYRSAEEQDSLETQKAEHYNGKFVVKNRLLGRSGDFSDTEILLAQGHSRLKRMPLLVYLLLQSDAFRRSHRCFCPSKDQRFCVVSQMASMCPSTLTRCIAPRIQLWKSGSKNAKPLVEVIGLRSDEIQLAVMECSAPEKAILMIDTPSQLLILDARYINSPAASKSAKPLVIGSGLKDAIKETVESYQVAPEILYELDQTSTSGESTLHRLVDTLVVDSSISAEHNSFDAWRTDVANSVQSMLGAPDA